MSAAAPTQKQLLEAVVHDAAPGTLIVLDLDDTLFLTENRHLRILREFADEIETREPQAAALLREIRREQLRYEIVDSARRAGLDDALAQDLRSFWFARFFKNHYLIEDDAVPGAPQFCAAVLARGGSLVYMTGRDEGMREGTERSFVRHGFPSPDGTLVRLILKPRFDTPDFAFKSESLARLKELGRVIATFENEPAHINLFRDFFPEARHFLLETRHSGKPVIPHADVMKIRDFRR